MREFVYHNVKNPEYYEEGRIPAHSDHEYYENRAFMEQGENHFRMSLNGLWKFAYAHNYAVSIKGFEALNYDCTVWNDIRVPAHIQMEGYDVPQYANVQYPWDGREQIEPGEIPERFNPVANYVKYFEVPGFMKNRPLYVSFQGVESAFALWMNGQYVGYSEDSFTPSEFDLTPYVREGTNKLALTVFKWCSGSWCEDQDFFRFSGIFRDVYLYTVPEVHIRDMKIQTVLADDLRSAELTLTVLASAGGRIAIALSANGRSAGELNGVLEEKGQYVLAVEAPELWSAETPFLYDLDVEVMDDQGNVTEFIRQKVGFRRFEIIDSIMCLNGQRIVFKGVNRHEFSSKSGRVVSCEELRGDIVTMKQNNINAIRTCHYPNDSRIYGLCDEYGLYLIDEANLESHGSWDPVARGVADIETVVPGNKPEWNAVMLDRVNSIYQRDKNHPSVLIWSCGNESFGGKNIYDMAQLFRSLDPGRVVHYEGVFNDRRYNDTSDVESQMYTSVEEIKRYLANDRSKPFICCEYAHAMGNSCGALHKYTDLTDTEPLYQGGFIWDYIDQTIVKKNRYGEEFQAYGGDFGERPCDYNFSGNGIVYGGNREPSPKMQEVKYNYQNIGISVMADSFEVKNKNLFTSTDRFRCVAILEKQGRRIIIEEVDTCVEPLAVCTYPLPFRIPQEDGEYAVTVSFRLKEETLWAKAGHETAFGQSVFRIADGVLSRVLKDSEKAQLRLEGKEIPECAGSPVDYAPESMGVRKPFTVIYGKLNLGVRGEHFDVLFSYNFGGMVSYRYAGRELLGSTPKPNFWRAPVDNDCGNDMMTRYGQWKLASLYLTHHGVGTPNPSVEEKEDCVAVTYRYLLPTVPAGECKLEYLVYGDGTIKSTLSYEPVEGLSGMPEFGVMFKMDAAYGNLEWYGMGEAETYNDRDRGAKLGIYHSTAAGSMAEYLVPQECGNRTGVRYARVTDDTGRGLLFSGDCMHFSALPYTPHELENAMHPYELPPVHYTVIRAALEQMGVGGDNSWGARTHEEYLPEVKEKKEFSFWFKGII